MIKNYALIALGTFLLVLAFENYIQRGKIEKRDADIARLESNNFQLMSDSRNQTTLYLREKERTGKLNKAVDSLAKALNVKSKQITKVVYIDNVIKDTVKIPVPVQLHKDFWTLSDTSHCIIWSAELYLDGTELKVWRTNLEDSNRITETFYRKRPKQFLFIKYGKWQNLRQIDAKCGGVSIQEFNFVK